MLNGAVLRMRDIGNTGGALHRFGWALVLVASLSNVTKRLIKATKKGNVYFGSLSERRVHRGQEGVLAGASSGSREINAGACFLLS